MKNYIYEQSLALLHGSFINMQEPKDYIWYENRSIGTPNPQILGEINVYN
jgi:hypothetical protein